MIRNTLWLSQISLDWSVLKKFHDHFERNMQISLHETRRTRPHDVSEITATYEYSMRIWEDEMKTQSPEGPKTFDEVLICCVEEEDYTIGGLSLRMTPRVASGASVEDRGRPYEDTTTRQVRARGRGRGRGGKGGGKGRGRAKGRGRGSTSRAQYNLWGDRIWSGAQSQAASTATQWNEPAPQTYQERAPAAKGKRDRKGKKGKGKSKGGSSKGEGKGACYFWLTLSSGWVCSAAASGTTGRLFSNARRPTAPAPAAALSKAQPPVFPTIATQVFGRPSEDGVWAAPAGGRPNDGMVPHVALCVSAYSVPGLECADVASAMATKALHEIQAANFGGSAAHQHLEIGFPFYTTSTKRQP